MTDAERTLGTGYGRERGAALFAVMVSMLLLSTMVVAFAVLARDETYTSQNSREIALAEFAAEAGANYGRWMLAQRLRQDLPRQVAATARPTMITALQTSYNTPAGAAQFLVDMALPQASGPTFALCGGSCPEPLHSPIGEIPDTQQVVLTMNGTDPTYTARVIVGVPPAAPPVITNGGTAGLFTYMWRVESTGRAPRATQFSSHDSVIATLPTGTFTIALNSSFVHYAHFIDQMTSSQAWISFRHVYTGPVHTNTRFNILGNPTGPTFRSEATQTFNDVRFNNAGAATTVARDSTTNDRPLLGPAPGVSCNSVDCTGFTRNYDFDPTTPAIDPIPFPAGPNPADRQAQIDRALGPTPCVASCPPVLVANTLGVTGNGTVNGGIHVTGNPVDLQLAATATGQTITIYTDATHRTLIEENRGTNTTRVRRQSNTGSWVLDPAVAVAARDQLLTGVFTPNVTTDYGVLFVTGSIGVAGTATGLRQAPGAAAAIYQDLADPTRGARWTIAADRNIWITGHLAYQVEPRGADLVFSSPIPGSGDDALNVQNVLGVVSWAQGGAGGVRLSSWLSGANLTANYPLGSDLIIQGMFMAPNISGAAAPSGQVSFDDPNGPYRGVANILGGVVQKTMGTFGSPGSPGTGYARNWLYDERFRHRGLSPPLFPGFPNFTAATSLGIDSFTWRGGRF